MEKISGLKCRECGRKYQAKAIYVCEFCFGPLEVDYNYEQIKLRISKEKIETGPNSQWRYWDLLPVGAACTFADIFLRAKTLKRFNCHTGVRLETISVNQVG